jgi:hypothetical protein
MFQDIELSRDTMAAFLQYCNPNLSALQCQSIANTDENEESVETDVSNTYANFSDSVASQGNEISANSFHNGFMSILKRAGPEFQVQVHDE